MQIRRATVDGPKRPIALSYVEWGDPGASRTVVCVHGLTRNARDFDTLAADLAARGARVICPDVAGRGGSERLDDPADYAVPVYAGQIHQMIERLGLGRVDWVGTSMGGLIGMAVAIRPDSPIDRLVLNDVGPFIPAEALANIATYLGDKARFRDTDEAEAYFRRVHAGFGDLTDAQWRSMAEHGVRPLEGGGLGLAYDPTIAVPFNGSIADADLWPVYDAITVPTLVTRGAESGLLRAGTAEEMTRRGPKARLVTFPGVGHAPALMDDGQIAAVRDFLRL